MKSLNVRKENIKYFHKYKNVSIKCIHFHALSKFQPYDEKKNYLLVIFIYLNNIFFLSSSSVSKSEGFWNQNKRMRIMRVQYTKSRNFELQ